MFNQYRFIAVQGFNVGVNAGWWGHHHNQSYPEMQLMLVN